MSPEQLAERERKALERRASSQEAKPALAVIQEAGEIGSADIAARIGWQLDRVRS